MCFFKEINIFFAPENMKNPPSNVAHNWPHFFQYWPGFPNDPQTEIPNQQKPFNAGLGIYTGQSTKRKIDCRDGGP
jgi:hypothetical protein